MSKKILVTGAAGFIGFHLCQSLLEDDYLVLGIDNLNDYYDPRLKKDRLSQLNSNKNFQFDKIDLIDRNSLSKSLKHSNLLLMELWNRFFYL